VALGEAGAVPSPTFPALVAVWGVAAGARVAGTLLRLAVAVLVGRLFGPLALALYFLTLTLANGAGLVASLGLESTAARFTAHHLGRDERSQARGVLLFTCGVSAAAGLVLAAAMFLGAHQLATWLRRPDLVDGARLAALAVLFGPVGAVARAGLTGLDGARPAVVLDQVTGAAIAVPTLLAMRAAGWDSPVAGVLAVTIGQVLTTAASLAVLYVRAAPLRPPAAFDPRPWLSFSAPMWLERGLFFVIGSTGYFLVARWQGTDDVAVFGAAVRVAMFVVMPLEAAVTILGPLFANLSGQGRWDELQRLYARATWALLATGAGLGAAVLLTGRWALEAFGTGLGAGYPTLVLLVLGYVVSCGTGPCGLMTVMTGHPGPRVANVAGGAVLTVVLTVLAVPRWGAAGAAGAIAVATTVLNVRQVRQVRRLVGLRTYDLRGTGPMPPAEASGARR
jgi:O-antigen/teichoic acid export membrane protein